MMGVETVMVAVVRALLRAPPKKKWSVLALVTILGPGNITSRGGLDLMQHSGFTVVADRRVRLSVHCVVGFVGHVLFQWCLQLEDCLLMHSHSSFDHSHSVFVYVFFGFVVVRLNAARFSSHFVSIHRGQYFTQMKTTT
eukprot:3005396-Amphidinium_carterae.1